MFFVALYVQTKIYEYIYIYICNIRKFVYLKENLSTVCKVLRGPKTRRSKQLAVFKWFGHDSHQLVTLKLSAEACHTVSQDCTSISNYDSFQVRANDRRQNCKFVYIHGFNESFLLLILMY